MLPMPTSQGIGALQLPMLPPTPSGPNPTGPGSFGHIFDQAQTVADAKAHGMGAHAIPQLPTSMEVRPLIEPASSLTQAWQASAEFPDAANMDGLQLPGASKSRPTPSVSKDTKTDHDSALSFLDPLKNMVTDASKLQKHADELANEAAIGGDVDLHDVMIAGEKASVAMQLTLQIRNKLVDAYQEVMRMQV